MTAWYAETILGLARSYWECRILLTAAELDLFARLKDRSQSAAELAKAMHVPSRGLTILLDAVTGMELLIKRDGKYSCPPDIAKRLAGNGPDSVLPMVLHSAFQWRKWTDLTGIVRGEIQPARHSRSPESLKAFIEAMDVVSAPRAATAVQVVRPDEAKRMIDVGGGPGTYTAAFLRACPNMTATLFDQPDVIEIARERFKAAGLLERVTLVGGDFEVDDLPVGHDLAWASAIIHQNSPAENVELYRKIFRALDSGGRIVVRDHVMEENRTHPRTGAVFAINMLVSTDAGNCYTFEEIRDDLRAAGFERVNLIVKDEQMSGLVEAFKP